MHLAFLTAQLLGYCELTRSLFQSRAWVALLQLCRSLLDVGLAAHLGHVATHPNLLRDPIQRGSSRRAPRACSSICHGA